MKRCLQVPMPTPVATATAYVGDTIAQLIARLVQMLSKLGLIRAPRRLIADRVCGVAARLPRRRKPKRQGSKKGHRSHERRRRRRTAARLRNCVRR